MCVVLSGTHEWAGPQERKQVLLPYRWALRFRGKRESGLPRHAGNDPAIESTTQGSPQECNITTSKNPGTRSRCKATNTRAQHDHLWSLLRPYPLQSTRGDSYESSTVGRKGNATDKGLGPRRSYVETSIPISDYTGIVTERSCTVQGVV